MDKLKSLEKSTHALYTAHIEYTAHTEHKLRVAVFCAYFYPHEGGVEKYVQKLFSGLKDIDVTIITSNSERAKPFEKKYGMDIYRFECWNLMNKTYPVIKFSEYKKIKKILKNKEFDYVITQTRFFSTALLGCVMAKNLGLKLIHFEHGTMHSPMKNPVLNMFGEWYDHTFGRYIIKNSWKSVGISKASCDFIKHLYKKAKPELIRNSVEIDELRRTSLDEQKRLRKELGIKTEKVIVFVGRVIYAKGIQDLLEAAKDLDSIKDGIKLVIVGNGNYLDELKKNYPWIIFVGEQKNVAKYLSIADVFVNPSYAEGLPTSVLEAGSVGVACIATDVGGTREIIVDGVTGNLIKARDIDGLRNKLIKLLKDADLRKKYSRNLQSRIRKEFTWKINKDKVQTLLNS